MMNLYRKHSLMEVFDRAAPIIIVFFNRELASVENHFAWTVLVNGRIIESGRNSGWCSSHNLGATPIYGGYHVF